MLTDLRILVVEDQYLLARDVAEVLSDAGAHVVGPVGTVPEALACIEAHAAIDLAVLDVNLAGEPVFPVAEVLAARGVPFLFASGYDDARITQRFGAVRNCRKPVSARALIRALGELRAETGA